MENEVDPYEVPGLIEEILDSLGSNMWDGPFIPETSEEAPF